MVNTNCLSCGTTFLANSHAIELCRSCNTWQATSAIFFVLGLVGGAIAGFTLTVITHNTLFP